jgi:alpha-tubulin suppressor-like RCC1 family protein
MVTILSHSLSVRKRVISLTSHPKQCIRRRFDSARAVICFGKFGVLFRACRRLCRVLAAIAVFVCNPVQGASAPFATTQPAFGITLTNASLGGMVSPNSVASAAWFEWGTNANYGQVTSPAGAGSGTGVARISTNIAGLSPHQVYHFRLVASNLLGVVRGADQTFVTGRKIAAWGAGTNYVFPAYGQSVVPSGLSNAVAVAGGGAHSLSLRTDGSVLAWGYNSGGQTNVPGTLTNAVGIAAGDSYGLALRNDGRVVAWGNNDFAATNVPANLTNAVAISAGGANGLALRRDGTVVSWGDKFNIYGLTNIPTGLSNVAAVAAGGFHCLALRNDGTVTAWGNNAYGQTSVPAGLTNVVAVAAGSSFSVALRRDGTAAVWGDQNNSYGLTNLPAGLTNVVAIAAGGAHVLALRGDGSIVAWGDDSSGQSDVPPGLTNALMLSGGASHSLAVAQDLPPTAVAQIVTGTVNRDLAITFSGSDPNNDPIGFRITGLPSAGALFQYGAGGSRGAAISSPNTVVTDALARVIFTPGTNEFGKPYSSFGFVATDGEADSSVASVVVNISGSPMAATTVAWGISTTNATLNGVATPGGLAAAAWFEWGTSTAYGQVTGQTNYNAGNYVAPLSFGIGNLAARQTYHYRLVVSNAIGMVKGLDQAFITGGKLAAWGYNYGGTSFPNPGGNYYGQAVVPPGSSNIVAVSAGYAHNLALRTDGTAFGWGNNDSGQSSVPPTLSNLLSVAASRNHSLALRSDGTVAAWGDNSFGQTNVPAGLSNVVAIAGGRSQSVALRRDGTLVVWGDKFNTFGQTNVPAGLTNIVAISCGDTHNLALRNDGMVLCWGAFFITNYAATNIPSSLSNVAGIFAGGNHSLALRTDGAVVSWGGSFYGGLAVPAGLTNPPTLACGGDYSLALRGDGTIGTWGWGGFGQTNVPSTLTNMVALSAGWYHGVALGPDILPVAINQTVFGAANADLVVTLSASDLSGDALRYRIISMPGSGALYQFAGGVRGAAITIPSTQVIDSGGRVIFAPALGAFGNPYATFRFVANDGEADSTEANVTIITGVPRAATQPAWRNGGSSAILNGMATPSGFPTAAWFEWGLDASYGQASSPVQVGSGAAVVAISLNLSGLSENQVYHFRLVVSNVAAVVRGPDQLFTTGRRAFGFGDDHYGQVDVPTLTNAVGVAAGAYHSLALLNSGGVVAWGDNAQSAPQDNCVSGQLLVPAGLNNAVAIAAGNCYSLALRGDGTLTAWGMGKATNLPPGLTGVLTIAGGGDHALALRTNGSVVAWGDSSLGQTNVPGGATNIVAVAAGATFSMALRDDGSVFAWGDNSAGQTNAPTGLLGIDAIAAGGMHGLASINGGSIAAWGNNLYGQATVVAGLTNVAEIVAGGTMSCAVRSDGVICWGQYRSYDPSFGYPFYAPLQPPPRLSGVVAMAGGANHVLALGGDYDFFDSRLPIMGTSIDLTVSIVGATKEPGEPNYFGSNAPGSSVWFSWTASAAGGVELTASDASFPGTLNPVLAVYTGTNLVNLTSVAMNYTPYNGQGDPLGSRVVFTAVAGQAYQISVDATNQGNLELTLQLTAPPVNDLFSNATPISGTFFETTGSFIGSGRETGERTHGNSSLPQTLWWNWTAPTNLGLQTFPVRLLADGVSFPPGLGAYIGDSLATLTNQISSVQTNASGTTAVYTNGMSSTAVFTATAGVTYHIALSGRENDPTTILTNFGSYQLRLNSRAFALSFQGLNTTSNADGSLSFQANAVIQNFGSNASNPLQVYLSAISGGSLRGTGGSLDHTQFDSGIWPATPTVLGPAKTSVITNIQGLVPAPDYLDGQSAQGWGVYAQLQEQPRGLTNWFTVDETLLTFGNWPGFEGVVGPGGGVLRLDPVYIGSAEFVSVPAIAVLGPTNVPGGSTAGYAANVAFDGGFTAVLTNLLWSASPGGFSIGTNGVFAPPRIPTNAIVTLTSSYPFEGFVGFGRLPVAIAATPTALAGSGLQSDGTFQFSLTSAWGQTNVIEASTNLSSTHTFWVPLATNAPANGIWNFSDFSSTNVARRFYRARGM